MCLTYGDGVWVLGDTVLSINKRVNDRSVSNPNYGIGNQKIFFLRSVLSFKEDFCPFVICQMRKGGG